MQIDIKSALQFVVTGINNGQIEAAKNLLQDVIDQIPDGAQVIVNTKSEEKDPYENGGD